jgi:hypothetical protein
MSSSPGIGRLASSSPGGAERRVDEGRPAVVPVDRPRPVVDRPTPLPSVMATAAPPCLVPLMSAFRMPERNAAAWVAVALGGFLLTLALLVLVAGA